MTCPTCKCCACECPPAPKAPACCPPPPQRNSRRSCSRNRAAPPCRSCSRSRPAADKEFKACDYCPPPVAPCACEDCDASGADKACVPAGTMGNYKGPDTLPAFPAESKSLAKKHLTPEIYKILKDVRTPAGYTVLDLVKSGLENAHSKVGVYLADEDCYRMFAPFVNRVIEDYHTPVKAYDKHTGDFNPANLKADNPDPSGKYINSTRIRVARNLKGYDLGSVVTKGKRAEIETKVSTVLKNLTGDLKGTYTTITAMPKEVQAKWMDRGMLFDTHPDPYLTSAGLTRDWPENRGFFVADSEKFIVWVNEEDEIRIVSMENGGDIKAVFTRLAQGVQALESKLGFLVHPNFGVLASCPTNIGTGMRASVHINLPNVYKKQAELDAICDKFKIQARGSRGELSKAGEGGIYDISNLRRLGLSEVQCVQDMYDGVKALIALEESCV